MRILLLRDNSWTDETMIQAETFKAQMAKFTIIPCGIYDPPLALYRYNPDMLWAFSDDLYTGRCQHIMDLAASREIPSTHYSHKGVTKYGW